MNLSNTHISITGELVARSPFRVFQRERYNAAIILETEMEILKQDYRSITTLQAVDLDEAWMLSQELPPRRSVSVGDIFQSGKQLHLVMPFGHYRSNGVRELISWVVNIHDRP